MFVSQGKYDSLRSDFDSMLDRAEHAVRKHNALNARWNALIDRINKKGGEDFLQNATLRQVPQFNEDELTKLVQLCHPDKHGGKQIATEMTQKLLALKGALTKEPA